MSSYDFIIVGAGPAGCALAHDLARSPLRPRILLLEAGPANDDMSQRILAQKWTTLTNPSMNWGYRSTPTPSLDDRVISLDRGRGLGGSSAVNFTMWTEGAREDWDRMAQLTGDEAWSWARVKERFDRLTTLHCDVTDPRSRGYINLDLGLNVDLDVNLNITLNLNQQPNTDGSDGPQGPSGPLHIGYPAVIDRELLDVSDALHLSGVPLNLEVNSGTLSGHYIDPETGWRGSRSTAADLLFPTPSNLVITTDTPIRRVLFDTKTAPESSSPQAVGVEALDGRVFHAAEVILCAGALDSPRILMHSGIGPSHLIPPSTRVIADSPDVGQNLQDHVSAPLQFRARPGFISPSSTLRDPLAQAAALQEWELHRTGPYASVGAASIKSFPQSAGVPGMKFADLPTLEKTFLEQPGVPSFEFCVVPAMASSRRPNASPDALVVLIALQYLQSRGRVTPDSFELNYLSHPYDIRQAIEATRHVLALMRTPAMAALLDPQDPLIDGPQGDSDEDIIAWWRQHASTTWHMGSTCAIGSVVDSAFRVKGVRGLRVVDCSVFPYLPAAHLQAHAYQLGMLAAEKIVDESKIV